MSTALREQREKAVCLRSSPGGAAMAQWGPPLDAAPRESRVALRSVTSDGKNVGPKTNHLMRGECLRSTGNCAWELLGTMDANSGEVGWCGLTTGENQPGVKERNRSFLGDPLVALGTEGGPRGGEEQTVKTQPA